VGVYLHFRENLEVLSAYVNFVERTGDELTVLKPIRWEIFGIFLLEIVRKSPNFRASHKKTFK
jgi:hypothetical protein